MTTTRRRRPAPRPKPPRLLSSYEARKLRAIPAQGEAPPAKLPLATLIVSGREPPRITTELRALEGHRGGGWQVTVSAADITAQMLRPPKFVYTPMRPSKIERTISSRLAFNTGHRPPWLAFEPEPKLLRRPGVADVLLPYHGKRLEPLSQQGEFDNRQNYRDTSYPWGCVCKITSGGKRTGSGVLIGPRHVLTASHVIDWSERWAIVDVHRYDNTMSSGSCVSRLSRFTEVDDVTVSTVDEDYVVLTTFERLGDQFGWMGNMTYDSGWDEKPFFRTIGYAGDMANGKRPVYERDFHLDEDALDFGEARAMTCGADLMKGQSGSPIFAYGKDGTPFVVAVVSAAGDDDNNYCSGGSLLTRLVREARALDP